MKQLEQSYGKLEWRSAVRGAIACLAALFVVLQSVASIGSSVSHRLFRDRPSASSTLLPAARTCTAGSDRHEPSHQGDHAECCVLCSQRDHFGDSFDVPPPDRRHHPPPKAIVTTAHHSSGAARPIIAGWSSSWSSRAPPVFS